MACSSLALVAARSVWVFWMSVLAAPTSVLTPLTSVLTAAICCPCWLLRRRQLGCGCLLRALQLGRTLGYFLLGHANFRSQRLFELRGSGVDAIVELGLRGFQRLLLLLKGRQSASQVVQEVQGSDHVDRSNRQQHIRQNSTPPRVRGSGRFLVRRILRFF